jgi:hypothetical protein
MPRPGEDLLHMLIRDPLERAVGSPLCGVFYFVMESDLHGFSVENPNGSGGCQAVYLSFGGEAIELDWDHTERAFRDQVVAYYLQPTVLPRRDSPPVGGVMHCEGASLTWLDASAAAAWRDAIGHPLSSIELWGIQLETGLSSPQAVTFQFPTVSSTVSLGITGAPHRLGYGDELLVFAREQWDAARSAHPSGEALSRIWP